MIFYQQRSFVCPCHVLGLRQTFVASVVSLAGLLSLTEVGVAAESKNTPKTRFLETVPWLPSSLLPAGEVLAFEEHSQFIYLAGRSTAGSSQRTDRKVARTRLVFLRPATLVVDVLPFEGKDVDLGQPAAKATVDVPLTSGTKSKRVVCVYQAPEQQAARLTVAIRVVDGAANVAITRDDREFELELPLEQKSTARISVKSAGADKPLLQRHLPAGVMPHGPQGMRMIEGWDSRYRGDSPPAWDKGFPSSHLKASIGSEEIKPGRAIVLGCGTGTNAIYLAKNGFDVTAIDVAPTAVTLAEEKAKEAGVKVRWLLADVLAPPADLGTFDFIFDRGCYHGVRRSNSRGYVKTVTQLSHSGTQILILAGNANEERHYGPPRVKEEELRSDFSSVFEFNRLDTVRFDSVDPKATGALGWSVLLSRKTQQ